MKKQFLIDNLNPKFSQALATILEVGAKLRSQAGGRIGDVVNVDGNRVLIALDAWKNKQIKQGVTVFYTGDYVSLSKLEDGSYQISNQDRYGNIPGKSVASMRLELLAA